MELNKNLTNTNRGKGMKTFKEHVKEGSDKTASSVGSQTTNSVEDSVIGVHNIHDADVLKRVNAFVGSIAEQEYIKNERKFNNLNIRHRNIVKYNNLFYKNSNLHIIMNYYPQDLYGYFTENDLKMDEYKIKIILKQLVDAVYHLSKNKLYNFM